MFHMSLRTTGAESGSNYDTDFHYYIIFWGGWGGFVL